MFKQKAVTSGVCSNYLYNNTLAMAILAVAIVFFSVDGYALTAIENNQVKRILENTMSTEQVLFMYAFGGAKIETLKLAHNDLTKSLKGKSFPKFTLVGGEINIDGVGSGIDLMSLTPLQLRHKGRVWSYETTQTIDMNYISLAKFLEPKPNAMQSVLFDAAYADTLPGQSQAFVGGVYAIRGGAVVGSVGGLAVFVCAVAEPCGILIGAGIVAATGIGALSAIEAPRPTITVTCSSKEVFFTYKGTGSFRIQKQSDATYSVAKRQGRRWTDAPDILRDNKASIDQLAQCNNPSDAKALEGKINAALSEAFDRGKGASNDTILGSPPNPYGGPTTK